jgi:quercetin dioxygenase-like cupin family protein
MEMQLPYTINNGTSEKLTFLRAVSENGIEYLEVENEVAPNSGPPMHVHYLQDEALTVTSGKIGYQVLGGEKQYGAVGDTILFKAGTPHKFWNAGTETLKCNGYITPKGNIVYFLSHIFKSSTKNGGRPGMYDAAFLLTKYKSEFRMHEIPALVQKLIFPVVLGVGKLLGKHKKYSEAPEAIS